MNREKKPKSMGQIRITETKGKSTHLLGEEDTVSRAGQVPKKKSRHEPPKKASHSSKKGTWQWGKKQPETDSKQGKGT